MTRMMLLIGVLSLAALGVSAQESPGEFKLHLKTGEILEGEFQSADEDGVRLDIGDGVELFIRWAYTRGDTHFELRKKQTDFDDFESTMRLADFCHEFAMDEQEAYVLVAALKLDTDSKEARERLEALPEIKGLEIPGGASEPEVEEPGPAGDDEESAPQTRGPFTVWIDMKSDDDATATWLAERFGGEDYPVGGRNDHEIRIEVEIELKLIRNPKFMGAELYAIYDGSMTYRAYRSGEDRPLAVDTVKVDEVRRDTKDEARASCRTSLLEEAFGGLFEKLESLR